MIDLDAIYKLNIIRPNSKAYLNYLYDYIISLFPTPDCFLEIGAFEASFSMRMRHLYPDSIIYAFEAGKTPYNYHRSIYDYDSQKINYLNLAISDQHGFLNYYVRKDPTTGSNGIIQRDYNVKDPNNSTENSCADIYQVETTKLDSFLENKNLVQNTKCMWIDVEGSSKKVLTGAEKSLKNTFSILIETEECPYWKDQWLRKDVENYLKSQKFYPIARDFDSNESYDIIFIKENILEKIIVQNAIKNYFNMINILVN